MSEWREARLGEVCSRLRSGTNITAKDIHEAGEVPVFGGNGIRGYASEPNFSGECAIIGRQGAYCGNVRYFNGSARMSEHAVVAVADAGTNTRFLAYLLSTMNLGRLSGQAAQPGLSVKILAQEPVLLPPLNLQARVASFVGSIDDLIENNRRRVEVLEEMARAIYREWFVKFRYPGHEDVPLVDSALGPMPEGWEHRRLFDAADVGFGYSFKSPRFSAQGPNQVIRIRDIPAGISSTFTDEVVIPRYAVSDDDVLVGMDGDFHMTVWTGGDAWLNQRVTRLRSLAGMSNLQLLLSIENQIVTWNKSIVGTTVAHLGKKHLELVTVLVSDGSTLERANAVFQPIMEQRRSLIQASRRLEALRDHLLPKLVTGQIDLSALDLDVLLVEQVA